MVVSELLFCFGGLLYLCPIETFLDFLLPTGLGLILPCNVDVCFLKVDLGCVYFGDDERERQCGRGFSEAVCRNVGIRILDCDSCGDASEHNNQTLHCSLQPKRLNAWISDGA